MVLSRSGLVAPDVVEDWRAFQSRSVGDGTFFGASNYYTYWRGGRSRSGDGQPAGGRPLARSFAGWSPAADHEPGQAITARAEVGIAVG